MEIIYRLSVKESSPSNIALMVNIYLSLTPCYLFLAIYSFDEHGEGKFFTSIIYMTKYKKWWKQTTSVLIYLNSISLITIITINWITIK